jgi:hypothetical protein
MKHTYHLERGIATPDERRAVFRQSSTEGGYLTQRGWFQGGEEVTRLISTSKKWNGQVVRHAMTFRNDLHARAWLGTLTQERTRR